jgi:hypothetical protein
MVKAGDGTKIYLNEWRITNMNDEIMIDGVKYRRVVEEPQAEPLKVGDWVECIVDDYEFFKKGAQGIVVKTHRNTPTGQTLNVHWMHGNYDKSGDSKWFAKLSQVRRIDPPAPEKPALKYAVGDVLLLPVRVVRIDDDDLPYQLVPLCDERELRRKWYTRAAVEGDGAEPAVGDEVMGFGRSWVGKLTEIDKFPPVYRIDGAWYDHAVKVGPNEQQCNG